MMTTITSDYWNFEENVDENILIENIVPFPTKRIPRPIKYTSQISERPITSNLTISSDTNQLDPLCNTNRKKLGPPKQVVEKLQILQSSKPRVRTHGILRSPPAIMTAQNSLDLYLSQMDTQKREFTAFDNTESDGFVQEKSAKPHRRMSNSSDTTVGNRQGGTHVFTKLFRFVYKWNQ
jgi:hypothetical protein